MSWLFFGPTAATKDPVYVEFSSKISAIQILLRQKTECNETLVALEALETLRSNIEKNFLSDQDVKEYQPLVEKTINSLGDFKTLYQTALEIKNLIDTKGMELLSSLVIVQYDAPSQEAKLKAKNGEFYFDLDPPKEIEDTSKFTLGAPCEEKTLEGYLQAIRSFQGDRNVLPSAYVNDFLSDPTLLTPGDTMVTIGKSCFPLTNQFEKDILRFSEATLNGSSIFGSKSSPTEPFLSLYASSGKNLTLTRHLATLLTQATLARVTVSLMFRFNHPNFGFVLIAPKEVDVAIDTKDPSFIEIRFKTIYTLTQIESKESKNLVFTRTVQLFKGERRDVSRIIDVISPFLSKQEAVAYTAPKEPFPELSWSCVIS